MAMPSAISVANLARDWGGLLHVWTEVRGLATLATGKSASENPLRRNPPESILNSALAIFPNKLIDQCLRFETQSQRGHVEFPLKNLCAPCISVFQNSV
ncbi:MAG: hypothetical protein JWM11_128 [Planctomycetaceae bacterium]|nr:hypothetical protein [Planctomycetaceae bacterium]